MAVLCRWLILFLTGLSCAAAVVANTPENRAFNAAAEAFRAGFFDRAEKEFADFAVKHAGSPRASEARLLQAQARMQLSNFAGAIELLSSAPPPTDALADQFAFWLAEATLRQGDPAKASALFSNVVASFPASSRALEATVNEAAAHARLEQWAAAISALTRTNSPFTAALQTSRTNALVSRGALLLGQSYLATGQTQPAEDALKAISDVILDPPLEWQRQHLLCRIRIAQNRFAEGLLVATNLLRMATNSADPLAAPEAYSIYATLLERDNRGEEALPYYEKSLVPGTPEKYQRQAILKLTELSIAKGRIANAAQVLEKFAAQQTNSPVLDVVLFASGELKLREFSNLVNSGTASPTATNLLEQATAALSKLVALSPPSSMAPRAQLSLGWCLWLQNKVAASQAAFKAAASQLPSSPDAAVALFKLGDTHLRLGDSTNAMATYSAVVDKYGEDPTARTNLIERALYQTVRAAIMAGDRATSTNALAKMMQWFPGGLLAERSVLLGGIEVSKYEPAEARAIYSEFIREFPQAELLPEVRLAMARSYEQEGDWTNAISQYNQWVSTHTNHLAMARAEYSRAWANAQAGYITNAFMLFTNFVARYPATEYAPMAHWWLGDCYLGMEQLENAERSYKAIFQSPSWAASDLAYQARMMAGRAAFKRQSGTQAAEYFTGLWNDTNCPADIRVQALFAYGDTLMTMEPVETNKVANYDEAIRVFSRISEMYPTNQIGILALGQKASCLLQWAQTPEQYQAALTAFQQIAASPYADGRVRSIAKVGSATVLEKLAERDPARKAELIKAALDHCLDVFYGSDGVLREGEHADPFWVRKAGLEGARLAELQGQWEQAIKIYQRLQELMPVLRPRMERNVARAQENLSKR